MRMGSSEGAILFPFFFEDRLVARTSSIAARICRCKLFYVLFGTFSYRLLIGHWNRTKNLRSTWTPEKSNPGTINSKRDFRFLELNFPYILHLFREHENSKNFIHIFVCIEATVTISIETTNKTVDRINNFLSFSPSLASF